MRTRKSKPTGTRKGKDSKTSTPNKNDDNDSKRSFAIDSSEELFDISEDEKDSFETKDDTSL